MTLLYTGFRQRKCALIHAPEGLFIWTANGRAASAAN